MSAVALGAGLVVTACSPVQLGAAAIVGNQRITIATLDTEVTNLSQTLKLYPGTVQLSQAQQTQQTLSWLIRFKVNPQFGQLNYNQVAIVAAPGSVSRPAGPAKATSQAGLSPTC